MAISAIAARGTAGLGASAGTTLPILPSATVAVGRYLFIVSAHDNIVNTDADNSDIISVSDTGFNAWVKMGEYTNGGGGAAAGATCSVWMTCITTQLTTASTVTITYAASIADRVCTLHEFSIAAGKQLVSVVTPVVTEVNAANGFGSAAISGLTSLSRLYFRGLAKEASTVTAITVSASFTTLTGTRSRNNAAAMYVSGEFRINTSTGETSNPTLAVSGDTASVFVALEERDPAVEYTPKNGGFSSLRHTPTWPDRKSKPGFAGSVAIDWGHKLARGLVSCWLVNEGVGLTMTDMAKPGRAATATDASAGSWTTSHPYGKTAIGVFLAGTQTDLQFTNEFSLSAGMGLGSDNYSEFLRCRSLFTTEQQCGGYALGFAPTTDISGAGIYLLHRANNQSVNGVTTGGAFTVQSGWTLGRMYRVTGTMKFGTEAKLYVDGALKTTNAAAGSAVNYGGGSGFQPAGAHSSDSRFQYGFVHARVLTADEAAWIAAEPFAMFVPVQRRLFFVLAKSSVANLSMRQTFAPRKRRLL